MVCEGGKGRRQCNGGRRQGRKDASEEGAREGTCKGGRQFGSYAVHCWVGPRTLEVLLGKALGGCALRCWNGLKGSWKVPAEVLEKVLGSYAILCWTVPRTLGRLLQGGARAEVWAGAVAPNKGFRALRYHGYMRILVKIMVINIKIRGCHCVYLSTMAKFGPAKVCNC